VQRDLDTFAGEGLRTLLLAKRELSDETWRRWNKIYEAASVSLIDRDLALESAAEDVEVSMEILGSTAIEDKLQIGVPDAISHLAAAKIKIWVLTGDKEETAINIGFACQLLDDTMDLTIVNQRSSTEILRVFKNMAAKIEKAFKSEDKRETKFALVVDGESLLFITREEELTQLMMDVTRHCVAVIACRVSPKQKADVVSLVKTNMVPTPMTLSIGDGANDVPMIQEAHVGIGISGNEGMQAVRASDYAIAQFRFLENLLLQHGRMNYRRILQELRTRHYAVLVQLFQRFQRQRAPQWQCAGHVQRHIYQLPHHGIWCSGSRRGVQIMQPISRFVRGRPKEARF
jgi:magnesium-transporting ATPase (P-type)